MSAAEAYPWIRALHVTCAVISIAGFTARGLLMLAGSPWLDRKFVRIAPHVVDTLLLASALWLAWFLGLSPLEHGWLAAKLLALLAYIALGSIALKRGRTRSVRAAAFAAALVAVAYIVAAALARDAMPWR